MYIRMVIVALAVLAGGCAHEEASAGTTAIQGKWKIAEIHGGSYPPECMSASYEIRAKTVTMRSGTLAITANYVAVPSGDGLLIKQSSFSNNGGKNCQGLSAEYVTSHYIADLEVGLVGDRLRIYFPTREFGEYTDFVRESR